MRWACIPHIKIFAIRLSCKTNMKSHNAEPLEEGRLLSVSHSATNRTELCYLRLDVAALSAAFFGHCRDLTSYSLEQSQGRTGTFWAHPRPTLQPPCRPSSHRLHPRHKSIIHPLSGIVASSRRRLISKRDTSTKGKSSEMVSCHSR